MNKTLTGNSNFVNNTMIFIDCLSDDDMHTAKRLYEDIVHFTHTESSPKLLYLEVASKRELVQTLLKLAEDCLEGMRPIIQFEGHGSVAGGLRIGKSGENISWYELVRLLRVVNINARNNLGVIMASCYGLHSIKPVSILEPSPYLFLIGSDKQLFPAELEQQLLRFYEALLVKESIKAALSFLSNKFQCFHAEKYFLIAFCRYVKRQCMGSGKQARTERLLTEIMRTKGFSSQNIKGVRKKLKESLKPTPDLFQKFAYTFLHGKVSVSFAQVIDFVKSQ